jgi:prepilin-type N-terminal cleavage/methylation domain-containing protein
MRKNAKNNKKGFTLIELIVVVAILVALMLMLVPRLTGFTDEATKTANTANARAIYTAINASKTAKATKLYSDVQGASNYQKEIKLCGADVYEVFWDEKVPADNVCKYDPDTDTVTYGLDSKTGTQGVYPIPDSTSEKGNS